MTFLEKALAEKLRSGWPLEFEEKISGPFQDFSKNFY